MKLHTQVQNYLPRMKFQTQVQNYIPQNKTSFLGKKLGTYLNETSYPGTKLPTSNEISNPGTKLCTYLRIKLRTWVS
jgi:hypothetical protein